MVHKEQPRASAALINSGGVRPRTSRETDVMIGIIMIAKTKPAINGVPLKLPESFWTIGLHQRYLLSKNCHCSAGELSK